jgi:hypothetical protein
VNTTAVKHRARADAGHDEQRDARPDGLDAVSGRRTHTREVNNRCRCWDSTAAEMAEHLGAHLAELDAAQLYRFVRAWHEVDGRYGPERRGEAADALGELVRGLVRENT